ncbi:MAG: hypothetical protein IPJ79_04265 [Bacteroidetes bacterium]|nr:hypothetical protein [Bacteroidota bacterium]
MRKKIILGVVVIIAMGIATGLYYYNKPVESLKNKTADIKVTSEKLFTDFSTNEENANTVYLNKIINVAGSVTGINKNNDGSVTLQLQSGDAIGSVTCKMEVSETDKAYKGNIRYYGIGKRNLYRIFNGCGNG